MCSIYIYIHLRIYVVATHLFRSPSDPMIAGIPNDSTWWALTISSDFLILMMLFLLILAFLPHMLPRLTMLPSESAWCYSQKTFGVFGWWGTSSWRAAMKLAASENLILRGLDFIPYAFLRARWQFKGPFQMASCWCKRHEKKVFLLSDQLLVINQVHTKEDEQVLFPSGVFCSGQVFPCRLGCTALWFLSIPTQVMPEKWASRIASSCESSMFVLMMHATMVYGMITGFRIADLTKMEWSQGSV